VPVSDDVQICVSLVGPEDTRHPAVFIGLRGSISFENFARFDVSGISWQNACGDLLWGEEQYESARGLWGLALRTPLLPGAQNVGRCHSERSEESAGKSRQMLRFAQHDMFNLFRSPQ
jgi:hypothetical protein